LVVGIIYVGNRVVKLVAKAVSDCEVSGTQLGESKKKHVFQIIILALWYLSQVTQL
jgi:hypothetical protein